MLQSSKRGTCWRKWLRKWLRYFIMKEDIHHGVFQSFKQMSDEVKACVCLRRRGRGRRRRSSHERVLIV
ncbi:hypothetical protein F383_07801 [Gossypium arboreum]|uniref:Uncharacterized protein n=1 Tax=Gossypium arboreum TaxID=29729 RepID=A0A0B0PH38_GOSAR|nr:hypothetical protein F383_07801 [Gossypium arboreum]